jgi:hypothetical protein
MDGYISYAKIAKTRCVTKKFIGYTVKTHKMPACYIGGEKHIPEALVNKYIGEPIPKNWISLKEANRLFCIPVSALRAKISKNQLPAKKIGRCFYIPRTFDFTKLFDQTNNIEGNRYYDCSRYNTCLSSHAFQNKTFSCTKCQRYTKTDLSENLTNEEVNNILLLLAAVFSDKGENFVNFSDNRYQHNSKDANL